MQGMRDSETMNIRKMQHASITYLLSRDQPTAHHQQKTLHLRNCRLPRLPLKQTTPFVFNQTIREEENAKLHTYHDNVGGLQENTLNLGT